MSKGISLDELKKQLEGSAQQKVEEQEKYIHKLEGQLQKAKLKNIEQDKEAYALFNRCKVSPLGMMCHWCGLSQRCHDIRAIYDAENNRNTNINELPSIGDLATAMLIAKNSAQGDKY